MGMQIDGYSAQAKVDPYSRNAMPGDKPQESKANGAVLGAKDSKRTEPASASQNPAQSGGSSNAQQDAAVQQQIQELVQIQNKVIVHEQAHMAVGGSLAGGASYSYTNGPDGKRYITGGEVSISIPSVDDPEEQIRLMGRVRAAALAPADPSPQDRSVAASASAREGQAAMELARKRAQAAYGGTSEDKASSGTEKSNKAASGSQLDISI